MTIQLTMKEQTYKKLKNIAKDAGKTVPDLASDILATYSADIEHIKKDPLYLMEGCDSSAPSDLASHHDHYLYED